MLRRVTYLLQTSEHLYAFKLYRTLEDETMMTIAQAQKWVRGFANSAKKDIDVRRSIDAIQAQIDAFLVQQKHKQ